MAFWNKGFTRVVVPQCQTCGYSKMLSTIGIPGYKQETVVGRGEKGILIVAEPRTLSEIRQGAKYEKSPIGQELRFRAMPFIDIFNDCWIIPASQCSPVKKSGGSVVDDDKPKRVGYCKAWIEKTITDLKPKTVILMGDFAIRTWFSDSRMDNISEYHLSDRAIPDHKHNVWILPIMGFNAPYSKTREEGMNNVFDNSFKRALAYADIPLPPFVDYDKKVRILTEYEDVVRQLQHVIDTKPEWFDFDYETNTLKPQTAGAILYSISWMSDDDYAYSTPVDGWGHYSPSQQKNIHRLLRCIFADNDIKKDAHNMSMENAWTTYYLKQPIDNWGWDSMVGAHMVDTRTGTKNLKFLAFVTFGFGPYNERIKPYLEAVNDKGINRIDEADKMALLHYGGLDSLFGRMLRQKQMKAMQWGTSRPNRIRDAYENVYLPGAVTMSEMSMNGFGCDIDRYNKIEKELREEQKVIIQQIHDDPAVRRYFDIYHAELSVSSNDDLRKLLFDIMGLETDKVTSGGQAQVNAEVLEELDVPICKLIHRWRKIEKVVGTFISQYRREYTADNRIHPSYNLHTTRTGRSSSSDPNFGLYCLEVLKLREIREYHTLTTLSQAA